MNARTIQVMLGVGIVCGCISLPLTWLAPSDVNTNGSLSEMLNSAFAGRPAPVTGLKGTLKLIIPLPVWLIVGSGIASSVLQLLRKGPPAAAWATAAIATLWTLIPVISSAASEWMTLGIGSLFGLVAAVVPMISLLMHRSSAAR